MAGPPGVDKVIVAGTEHRSEQSEIVFNEYVVLDSAGRLQLPREWLEQLGISKRAQLERGEGTILVRPAEGLTGEVQQKKQTLEDQIALLFNEEPSQPRKNLLKRLGRRK
jgi:bifunctional DNA-binding transcriptional regulator/antitoxin component of YhaV-PrlF toxin-antitoxin module